MKTSLPYLILLLSPSLVQEVSALSPMRAGIAIVDITPPLGTLLGGFEKSRRAEKVHDSLFARILVLKTPVLPCSCIGSAQVAVALFRESHSYRAGDCPHHSPVLADSRCTVVGSDTRHGAWGQEVESKIFQQVKLAHENLFSAKILFGQGALMGAHNIRVFQDDGTVHDRLGKSEGRTNRAD